MKGGFPFAYLYDAPGVSRERQLAFVEGKLHLRPFLLNLAVHFALSLGFLVVLRRWRSRR